MTWRTNDDNSPHCGYFFHLFWSIIATWIQEVTKALKDHITNEFSPSNSTGWNRQYKSSRDIAHIFCKLLIHKSHWLIPTLVYLIQQLKPSDKHIVLRTMVFTGLVSLKDQSQASTGLYVASQRNDQDALYKITVHLLYSVHSRCSKMLPSSVIT